MKPGHRPECDRGGTSAVSAFQPGAAIHLGEDETRPSAWGSCGDDSGKLSQAIVERRGGGRSAHFPDLPQRTVYAVDRIVIGNWQSCDSVIGFWPFARQTSKQIPLTSVRGRSHNVKVRTRSDALMRDTSGNENDVAGPELDGLAVLAAESQSCGAIIDTERFVRRAVIMSKGIDAVSPGVAPIVLSESALKTEARSARPP